MLATFLWLSVKWVVCIRSQCQSCADKAGQPSDTCWWSFTATTINQIRGVRRYGLFDWYYVSLCCEENSIYKVATNCLWEVSQYGACQTIISTEGPLCWGKVTLWVKCQLRFYCHFWKVLVWQWCHCILFALQTRKYSSSWQQLLHPWCNT